MTIKSKLLSGFAVVLSISVILSLVIFINLKMIHGSSIEADSRADDAVLVENSVWMAHRIYSVYADAYINQNFSENAIEFDAVKTDWENGLDALVEHMDTEEEKEALGTCIAEANDMVREYAAWIDLVRKDDRAGIKALDDRLDGIRDSYIANMRKVSNSLHGDMQLSSTDFQLLIRITNLILILLTTGSVVIGTLFAFAISRSIIRPIHRVTILLKDISEGEGDLTKLLTIESKDEIGDLSTYFNLTLKKIRDLVISIKEQARRLSEIGIELSANMNETAASVNQINGNLTVIKDQTIHQSASVTETNSTMHQITQNIEKLNANIDQQSANVNESSASIEEMLANISSVTKNLEKNNENVTDLSDASAKGHKDLSAVSEKIKEIARESEGLIEISKVIGNIASQTNLLSMNAAIEAAHAGESGRGFAVVADEIRKLAESSATQSKTVSSVLKKIKISVDQVASSTDTALKQFDEIDGRIKVVSEREFGIRNAMDEQGAGSKEILQAISQLNDITVQVKSGSDEMLTGSQEVIKESGNLGTITAEVTGSINEMASGVQQITAAVNKINEMSNENKACIDSLIREVGKFKVD